MKKDSKRLEAEIKTATERRAYLLWEVGDRKYMDESFLLRIVDELKTLKAEIESLDLQLLLSQAYDRIEELELLLLKIMIVSYSSSFIYAYEGYVKLTLMNIATT